MRSFGFYYSLDSNCKQTNNSTEDENEISDISVSEIHLNLWELLEKHKSCLFTSPQYSYFLDFGIKFNSKIKSLLIYLPFDIKKESIKDLGIVLTNKDVACLVFNEDISENNNSSEFYQYVEICGEKLAVYPLGSSNFTTSSITDNAGSYLEIEMKSDPQNS